jgi:putative nucleotidyltransferase with HDIG domain
MERSFSPSGHDSNGAAEDTERMIPTTEQCLEFMTQYEMLENIKDHSIMVEKIARVITTHLNRSGSSHLSLERISAGALLHDIGKTRGLNEGETYTWNHADMGKTICLENNLDEIADIVREHVRLENFDPDGDINEKEIVYYADKRVTHEKIVDLEERTEYLLDHYAKGDETRAKRIKENMVICARVEKKLFAYLPFEPHEMALVIQRLDK